MIPFNTRFLIVDDLPSIRKLLKSNLAELGFDKSKLHEAKNITEAMEILNDKIAKNNPVEYILSDWEMPGGTGLEFLEQVRAKPECKSTPFLMITTVSEKDNVLDAIVSGASNYLIKPWNLPDLKKKLEDAWKKHNK